jgi:folate receptor
MVWYIVMLLAIGTHLVLADEDDASQCRPMESIFHDGKDLCERLLGHAFKYVPRSNQDYNLSYTMWFFDGSNPNDATTQRRIQAGKHARNYQNTDVCHLRSEGTTEHRPRPVAANATFTECHPFRKNACCQESRVENSDIINRLYGEEYRWDRCGKISQECERFFVQEACMYECDPNAGLFRKNTPEEIANNSTLIGTEWELEAMPIQGDYCDAWFVACRYESFCGDGDFFSCAKLPSGPNPPLSGGAIAGIVFGGVFLLGTLCILAVLIHNERHGTPLIQKITAEDTQYLEEKPTNTREIHNTPNKEVTSA